MCSPSATPSCGSRLQRKGQGEDAAVGAHAGVPEQVPGAADLLAPLQDDVARVRVALGEPVGRAEARDAGADDDDVDVVGCLVASSEWHPRRAPPGGRTWLRTTAQSFTERLDRGDGG